MRSQYYIVRLEYLQQLLQFFDMSIYICSYMYYAVVYIKSVIMTNVSVFFNNY